MERSWLSQAARIVSNLIAIINGELGRRNATYRKENSGVDALTSPGKQRPEREKEFRRYTTRQQTDDDWRKAAGSPERRWDRSESADCRRS